MGTRVDRGWAIVTISVVFACQDPESPCPSSNPATVVDSTGVEFSLTDACHVASTDATPRFYDCQGAQTGYLLVWARFVSVVIGCFLGGGAISSGTEGERPLSCEGDGDCPTLYGDVYECTNGLCQHTDQTEFPRDTIDAIDAYLMCYGPVDRSLTIDPVGTAVMDVKATVQTVCPDGGCTLPLPGSCLQP